MKYVLAPFVGVGIFVLAIVVVVTAPIWMLYLGGLDLLNGRRWR